MHNVTGRVFDAFTNKTFSNDYTVTAYKGTGEVESSPYEKLDITGTGEYYTGFFELYDLKSGVYTAVIDADNYIKNF